MHDMHCPEGPSCGWADKIRTASGTDVWFSQTATLCHVWVTLGEADVFPIQSPIVSGFNAHQKPVSLRVSAFTRNQRPSGTRPSYEVASAGPALIAWTETSTSGFDNDTRGECPDEPYEGSWASTASAPVVRQLSATLALTSEAWLPHCLRFVTRCVHDSNDSRFLVTLSDSTQSASCRRTTTGRRPMSSR